MTKQIPLQNGMFALVDDEDYERCMKYNWYLSLKSNGVKFQVTNTKTYAVLHRFILNVTDPTIFVSCIDKNQLDCRKENLAQRTLASVHRCRRAKRGSTSRYKGVSYDKYTQKWVVGLTDADGKNKRLGRFVDEDDAARAYNKAITELWGDDCYINIIGEDNRATSYEKPKQVKQNRKRNIFNSKYRGVTKRKQLENPWRSDIHSEGKVVYLGVYKTEIEAAKAYDKKAIELFGDEAILNFP